MSRTQMASGMRQKRGKLFLTTKPHQFYSVENSCFNTFKTNQLSYLISDQKRPRYLQIRILVTGVVSSLQIKSQV